LRYTDTRTDRILDPASIGYYFKKIKFIKVIITAENKESREPIREYILDSKSGPSEASVVKMNLADGGQNYGELGKTTFMRGRMQPVL
jgi:hypothetical protein